MMRSNVNGSLTSRRARCAVSSIPPMLHEHFFFHRGVTGRAFSAQKWYIEVQEMIMKASKAHGPKSINPRLHKIFALSNQIGGAIHTHTPAMATGAIPIVG